MIAISPLELIVLLLTFGLLCWRAGFHSATWPDPDERSCAEHDERMSALDRIHDRRSP